MSDWRIRAALPTDAAPLTALVQNAYQPYVSRMGQKPGPMLDDYGMRIAHDQVWIAEQASHLIGGLVLIVTADTILLDNIAVHPKAQGLGVGKALLDLADNQAVKQGFTEIELYTHVAMVENIALYQKLGWCETDRRRVAGFDRVYMSKSLKMK